MTTQEVAVVNTQSTAVVLWGTDDPRGMTARMTAVADAMAEAVRARGMAQKIDGREYVRAEGWALVGAMLGVFPRTAALEEIREEGVLVGFRATTELVTRDGAVVGGAVSLCTISEDKWASRDWNQLASMAQTRANAKAYRQTLGFIMPMAGYAATPAEEMDGIGREQHDAPRGERPQMGRGVSAESKRNGVFPPPGHLENIGHLMQYARFHHGWGPHEVCAVLGGNTPREVAAYVNQDYSGDFDAAAATLTFKAETPPDEATEVAAEPIQAALA